MRRVLLAYLGGTLCAVPVLLMSVGNAESAFPVGWTPSPLAILFGSTGALLLGLPALWRLRGTAPADLFRVLAVCWMVSAFFVVLPHPNTQDKLPFAFFLLPGAAAGWTLARWARALKRRKLGAVAALLTGVILVPATGLILAVYLFEAGDPSPTAAERELYTWVAETTPPNAVFVDTPERDDLLVRANRRQLWGREPYALQWGYPVEEMDRRRRVRDLLTPEGAANTSGGLAALDAYAAEYPVYLVWRPADHGGASAESSVMARFPSRFQRVWDNAEATVYVYRPS